MEDKEIWELQELLDSLKAQLYNLILINTDIENEIQDKDKDIESI